MTLASPLRPLFAAGLMALHLGVGAAPAAPAATATFDTTPRPGQHQRLQIDMQATVKMRAEAGPDANEAQRAQAAQAAEKMAQMGPMKMTMHMQQTLKVGNPDADGWLPMTVDVGAKSGQMEVGGKVMPMPNQKVSDLSVTARFNPRDFSVEVQNVEGAPQLGEMMRTQGNAMVNEALQLSKALSQKPMKVGESVDVPLNLALPMPLPGGAGNMGGQVRYTLVRLERGIAYFDLGMDLKVDADVPVPTPRAPQAASAPEGGAAASAPEGGAASAPAAAPKVMHMRISGHGQGTSQLRLADRLPLANKLSMDMLMTMEMPDNGIMHMDMNMLMTAKGESLARPASPKAGAKADKKKS